MSLPTANVTGPAQQAFASQAHKSGGHRLYGLGEQGGVGSMPQTHLVEPLRMPGREGVRTVRKPGARYARFKAEQAQGLTKVGVRGGYGDHAGIATPYEGTDTPHSQIEPKSKPSSDVVVALRAQLHKTIGATRFGRYFGQTTGLMVGPGWVEVAVPSPFMAELIERRFGSLLCRLAETPDINPASAGSDGAIELRIRVDRSRSVVKPASGLSATSLSPTLDRGIRGDAGGGIGGGTGGGIGGDSRGGEAPAFLARSGRAPAPSQKRSRRLLSRLRHRLDDFVVGDSNRLAYGAAARLVQGLDEQALSPLFLHGPSGVGKSHLLQGIAAGFAQRNPSLSVRYISAEAFTNEYIRAVRAGTIDRFRKTWRGVELLCLDDVHFVAGKEGTQRELLYTLEAIGFDRARIVLASDEHPRSIAKLAGKLTSRFLAGAVIKIDTPDPSLLPRLVVRLASARNLLLDEDAIAVIVHRAQLIEGCSVRDLEGLLTQIEAVRRLMPEMCAPRKTAQSAVLDAGAVRRALELSQGASARRITRSRQPIRFELIRDEVCQLLSIDQSELYSKGRHRRVVLARGLAVRLARELTTMSFPEIARGLGRPSHSTVVTAHTRVLGQLKRAEPLRIGPDFDGQTIVELLETLRSCVLRAAGR